MVNLLSNNGGITSTAVVVAFENGGSAPCFTTTLAFQGAITVWAGIGQACVTTVTSITITPVAGLGGMIYEPPNDLTINGLLYSTQIVISQNTAPVFDVSNGSLISSGTVLATIQSQLTQWIGT